MKKMIYKTQQDVIDRVMSGKTMHRASIPYAPQLDIAMKLEGLSHRIDIEDKTYVYVISNFIKKEDNEAENLTRVLKCIDFLKSDEIERIINTLSDNQKKLLGIEVCTPFKYKT